jgi:hypothetical protein
MNAPIAAIFGRTAGGLLAGKVEDFAWLAVPHAAGLRILSGWQTRKPLAAWTVDDFYGADGIVSDEAAFRERVEETAEHRRELLGLGRQSLGGGVETPWGGAQHSMRYGDGIVFHSTASHGGFFLVPDQNVLVHAMLRNAEGWYEEDAEWAKVAFTFPSLFTAKERRSAEKTLRDDQPDAWETILGVALLPGESFVKDRRRFRSDNADHWVVISASRSADDREMIDCIAALGGVRASGELRRYRVPRADYVPGAFGFVIDEGRHARTDPGAAGRP